MSDLLDVVVYGATGYTGRLVSAELARRKVRFAIAGRDSAKLAALASTLAAPVETIVAGLDDGPALARMADRARVVLDCAGPFADYGRPVQDAAIAAGHHFLDITGEHTYMLETYKRDAEARAHGVALINAVGFDVVPTDAAAVIAAEAAGQPVGRVRIAFMAGGRATQGTTRSALRAAHLGSLAFVHGKWTPEAVGAESWDAPLPEPFGVRRAISVPWGDVATAPRSTNADTVRTYLVVSPRAARFMKLAGPLGRVLRIPTVRSLAERWVRRLPEGPSDAERARSRFAVLAEAEGPNGIRRAWVTGGNGYDFTAASAAVCAIWAARPTFAGKGCLTPTQAFDARGLLDALADQGVAWGVSDGRS